MPQSGRWRQPSPIPMSMRSDPCRDHRPIRPDDLDGQGVDAAFEFGVECLHYGTMLLQTGAAGEVGGGDSDAKMALAPGSGTGMTFVAVAFIEHFKMARSKFMGKFLNNRIANGHMDTGSGVF
jgi:hypothetical protein